MTATTRLDARQRPVWPLSLCPHSLAGGADREQMDLQTLATTLMFALVAVGHNHRSDYICSLARMRALGMFPGVPKPNLLHTINVLFTSLIALFLRNT